jgi:uncharacterized repeat protein (TIGR03803 family)
MRHCSRGKGRIVAEQQRPLGLLRIQLDKLFASPPEQAGGFSFEKIYLTLQVLGHDSRLYECAVLTTQENVIMRSAKFLGKTSHSAAVLSLFASLVCSPLLMAQNFTVLHSFTGADGARPYGSLSLDTSGNLYGTTVSGGGHDLGTIFKLKTNGTEVVLHSFSGYPSDGSRPSAGLIRDAAGNFLGTTGFGGKFVCILRGLYIVGCGTVFKLDTTGHESTLYSFPGGYPDAALVRDSSGNLYGTTSAGGADDAGTVFKLTPSGTETVLHSFTSRADGGFPHSTLLLGYSGNFIGTTYQGGYFNNSLCAGSGCGVIFKVTPSGSLTVLHRFTGGTDGAFPGAGLIQDGSGNLYGTTVQGGSTSCDSGYGCGMVFKLDTTNKKIALHRFNRTDGAKPYSPLIRDSSGNLYGTTSEGGAHNMGTVFKLAPSGTFTVLHSFSGLDGATPRSGLIRDAAGTLYGTASAGGAHDKGTVYRIAF